VDLRQEPYSTTFSDLFFRNVRLNRHIEVILRKSRRRWKITSTYDRAQFIIFSCWCNFSSAKK